MTLRTLMQAGPAKANELFTRLAETSDGAVKTRERLFTELKAELELHTSLEEQHLFPVLRRNPETRELAADAVRDNKELRARLMELEAMPKGDPTFAERLSELQRAFRQHARDERKELLPAVRRALSEEQVQSVTEKMEAGIAEAEQSRQDEAEERRARARQEREQAEQAAREAEQREHEEADAAQRLRVQSRHLAETALRPMAATARAMDDAVRQMSSPVGGPTLTNEAPAMALTRMLMWPWLGVMQAATRSAATNGGGATEEVIPLGEEVLEIGKRTEHRGTARIRRFVIETPVEQELTLYSERVVVERRRPVTDAVTGEILTDVTIEVIETEEVPTIEKRSRLREEIVVRTERSQRVEMVRDTVRRDEVEIEQPGRKRGRQQQGRS